MSKEAFSYSRLTSFEECPKRFYAISVAKTIKDQGNEFTEYGTMVHNAFAHYVSKGTPLPLAIRQFGGMLDRLRATPGEKLVEQKLAINEKFAATGWFDKDAYCRVINDLTIINGSTAWLIDWKTGKPYDDFTQLRLAGTVIFLMAPEIEKLILSYAWLKDKTMSTARMVRADVRTVWAGLLPRLKAYQTAHEKQEFPARPGKTCRYCPLKSCPHNESRK